jgi:hypothetical protein
VIKIEITHVSEGRFEYPRKIHTIYLVTKGETWGKYTKFYGWLDYDPSTVLALARLPHMFQVLHVSDDGPTELVYRALQKLRMDLGSLKESDLAKA